MISDRECTIPTYIAVATYSGFGFPQNLIDIDVKLLKVLRLETVRIPTIHQIENNFKIIKMYPK